MGQRGTMWEMLVEGTAEIESRELFNSGKNLTTHQTAVLRRFQERFLLVSAVRSQTGTSPTDHEQGHSKKIFTVTTSHPIVICVSLPTSKNCPMGTADWQMTSRNVEMQ